MSGEGKFPVATPEMLAREVERWQAQAMQWRWLFLQTRGVARRAYQLSLSVWCCPHEKDPEIAMLAAAHSWLVEAEGPERVEGGDAR